MELSREFGKEIEAEKAAEALKNPFIDRSFYDEIVGMVNDEYRKRQARKKLFETKWQLNFDFLEGRQYSVADYEKNCTFDLEREGYKERVVLNEIAPIFETRAAKLRQLNKFMSVMSATSENDDIKNASISTEILKNTYEDLSFDDELVEAVNWSEVCGSVFIKSYWDNSKGELVSEGLYTGGIATAVVSPFEIYPEDDTVRKLQGQNSIIHARVLTRNDLFMKYGICIAGSNNTIYSMNNVQNITGGTDYETSATVNLSKSELNDSAVLMEYYEAPNRFYKNGRLIIVCEDAIIHYGELPYKNAEGGRRCFPFVKIDCISKINSFFGGTVIERLIPVQQNYNAIQNRINDYLARATIGVPLIEEDSLVNPEEIEDNGLVPGQPVYYTKQSVPPKFMDTPSLPGEFFNTKDDLKEDFIIISGVSEISRNSNLTGSVSSGIAIQILQQQDDTRISLAGKNIISAIKEIGRQWLYLYKQFATTDRIVKYSGVSYAISKRWNNSNLTSFDVRVCEDSNMFVNSALTRELGESLKNDGFIGQDRFSKLMYVSMLKNGDINEVFQEEFLDIKNAEKENYLFQDENIIPVIHDEDDHELHLRVHNTLRKGDWFRDIMYEKGAVITLGVKFNEHCRQHEQRIAEAEAQAQQAVNK